MLPAIIIAGSLSLIVSPTLRKETKEFGVSIIEKGKKVYQILKDHKDDSSGSGKGTE
jgi:hypothetical protein